MIRLKVEEYCHNCPAFEPDTIKNEIYSSEDLWGTDDLAVSCTKADTVITCVEAKKCRNLVRYLRKEVDD